jgi:hypothetical protein
LQIEKEENQKNYKLINIYFWYPTVQSLAIFALWLHLEVPQKNIQKYSTNTCFENILMSSSYNIRIRQNWYCQKHKHKSFKET